jgi:uncharacterized protein YyaL (SSP411 family)
MPNRLSLEKSPYLLQHASNPVDWMPWGDEAFAKAKAEDKLILVSIGYSTCHWCHVMEHESFSDPKVAELMNQNLVCVKVDREERPDVDRVYMNAVMALSGSGGWPLNCFITPDAKPIYGGTYFPPQPAFQRPSWTQLVSAIGQAWKDPSQRLKMQQDSETLTAALKRLERPAEALGEPGAAPLNDVFKQLRASYDDEHGGFTNAPKFPMPGYQALLFRLSRRFALEGRAADSAQAAQMALDTLRAMARGGIHDQLGGGFARYSTDERWHVPHFEKMLYDNAQLALNFLDAWQLSQDGDFARVLRSLVAYVLRDLKAPQGGFFSAEDADSLPQATDTVKKEGAFYAWPKPEIDQLLGPELGPLFCAAYGVEAHGNVDFDPHQEFNTLNVLHDRRGTLAGMTGGTADLAPEALEQKLAQARTVLFQAREKRPRPHRDEKILSSWNGLMIAALAKAGAALGEGAWVDAAAAAGRFFLGTMWDPSSGRLWRRWAGGEAAIQGQADDYAFLAWGFLELHQATLDSSWLEAAQALLKAAKARFFDESDGSYFNAGLQGDARLPVRLKDSHDNVEPAPASVFVELQLRLWNLTGEAEWRTDAERGLKACYADLARAPRSLAVMAGALDRALRPGSHLVVCGPKGDAATLALLAAARRGYHPTLDLWWTEAGAAPLPGGAGGFSLVQGKPAAYLCQGLACSAPMTDPDALTQALQKGATA